MPPDNITETLQVSGRKKKEGEAGAGGRGGGRVVGKG